MEYLRLSRKYFKQNIRTFYLLILSIAIGVALVFSFQVAKRSQAINNMNYINEISPTYNAEARNLDIKTTELLKNNENVKSIEISKNFGQFIYNKTGNALFLNEYNANIIKSSKLKLTEGREPKNSNEIIINKELASSSNLKIGDSINGFIRKEYISNGSNDLFMNNKSFKIVGIIQPKYDTGQMEIYTTLGKEENLIPKEAIGYDSIINLKSGFSDLLSNVNKIGRDVGESQNTILANELHQRLIEEINSESIESPDLEKVIIASILFVTSVFGLFMRKRLKDIGLIRIVGGSKRGFSLSIIFEHLLIAFLGCALGLILGYIIAIFLNKYVYLSSIESVVSVENRQLYLKWKDVNLAIKLSLANVSISIIIQLIALNFSEKLDLIKEKNCFDKKIEKISLSRMNLCFIKKITTKLALKNFTRSFIPMSISIIVVMLASGRWIDLSITQNMNKSEIPTRAISSFQSRDNKLTKNVYYDCLYGINENDLQKLKNIDGVSNILKLKNFDGYGVIPQDMLSDEIKSNNNEQDSSDELLFTISGYEKDYLKNKDTFSSGGYKDLDKNELSALITENFYDKYNGHKNSKIFKNLKVGDIIKVKLPVMESNLQKYKIFDVKVAGVLNEKWWMYKDSPGKYGEIVFDINKLNDITNSNTYTTLKFDNSGNLNDIKSSFNEKNYSIENIKDVDEKYLKIPDEFYCQLIVITIFLMIIAFSNIYSAIKGSIMLRKKEISITRALGASQNTIYKMMIKESLIYGFICAMAGSVYGFLRAYNYYELSVKASNQVSGFSTIKFEIPILQVIMLFMSILIFCFIIVNISLKTILKEDIVNGIRNGE
ncbi:ABC transporter permease [Romboutsia maritimum]|uniref:ABC transporter permease n=1 Tax=Romboutsia maritimum TaxID=2020948 RepID=A0A371IQU7_9FIRM|nr:FtsX-like permease family protein [Romboutsia maritimum]RDY22838.1 ABC transporter permease [Romboutsia maritimum]